MDNYYEILGVSHTATLAEIKAAYRKLAIKYHPDRNPNNKAAESKMKVINQVYRVLSNSKIRAEYDHDYKNWKARQKEREENARKDPFQEAEEQRRKQEEWYRQQRRENARRQQEQQRRAQTQYQYYESTRTRSKRDASEIAFDTLSWIWEGILNYILKPVGEIILHIVAYIVGGAIGLFLMYLALAIIVRLFVFIFIR